MEKTFPVQNVDLNSLHDAVINALQSNGYEIHRDEPRDNGFKVFVRGGEGHGEVEVFNDWGALKVITRGRHEWELMSLVEQVVQGQVGGAQQTGQAVQQGYQGWSSPQQQAQQQATYQPQAQQPAFQQYPSPQPQQQPIGMPMQVALPEHQQLMNVLMQNSYQIVVNHFMGQNFFIRARKGNYVIDIEGRPYP